MKNKFEIKRSPIEGLGAFAVKKIKDGELICHMEGEEITLSELKKRYNEGVERPTDPLQKSESTYIDLNKPYININHSCEPNAVILNIDELIAIKTIEKGQEITYDYSLTEWSDENFWQGFDDWSMICRCGSLACRSLIREFPLLPKDIQERSIKHGYVRDFIVKKYI